MNGGVDWERMMPRTLGEIAADNAKGWGMRGMSCLWCTWCFGELYKAAEVTGSPG
jgi:hypothetical protein